MLVDVVVLVSYWRVIGNIPGATIPDYHSSVAGITSFIFDACLKLLLSALYINSIGSLI